MIKNLSRGKFRVYIGNEKELNFWLDITKLPRSNIQLIFFVLHKLKRILIQASF